jgi:hypothetical protein
MRLDVVQSTKLDTNNVPGSSPEAETSFPWAGETIWAFVALAVLLRLSRYLMNYPLWADEAFVAVNFLTRGYRDLLRPLDYGQICPLLFLWAERTAVAAFNFSEWSLRLYPLLCGIGSLFVFRHIAARLNHGIATLLAVAIFAVSFHPIRHAAEVKPYASDLLAALLLTAAAVEWLRAPRRAFWLWALVALVPVSLAMSHPAVFVAGGVSIALFVPVRRSKRAAIIVPYILLNAFLVGTFVGLLVLFVAPQGAAALPGLRDYWASSFPPLTSVTAFCSWLVRIHTGSMFAYPGGGQGGASAVTFLLFLVGAVSFWRTRRRTYLTLCLAPFALTFVAAVLKRYPYGGEARIMQFVAPSICLLAAQGVAVLWRRISNPRVRVRLAAISLVVLAGMGITRTLTDFAHPYRAVYDHRARQLARRFWREQSSGAEVLCLRAAMGIQEQGAPNFRSAQYLCNQKMYSPHHELADRPDWSAIAAEHPLRCVLYHDTRRDNPRVIAWLDSMAPRYDLRETRTIVADMGSKKGRPNVERIIVFEFIPRRAQPTPAIASGKATHTDRR